MTVFSANLFGRFYGEIFYRSDIACKELSCVRVYSEMGHLVYMYFKYLGIYTHMQVVLHCLASVFVLQYDSNMHFFIPKALLKG